MKKYKERNIICPECKNILGSINRDTKFQSDKLLALFCPLCQIIWRLSTHEHAIYKRVVKNADRK